MTTLVVAGRGLLQTHRTFLPLTAAEARQWGMTHLKRYADGQRKKRTRYALVHMHDMIAGKYVTQKISYTPR